MAALSWGVVGVARTTSTLQARARARAARQAMDERRDARDRRVEEAAAAVYDAKSVIARTDETLAATKRAHDEAVAATWRQIAGSLGLLADEGLTRDQIATLCGLPPTRVRRLLATPKVAGSDVATVDQQHG